MLISDIPTPLFDRMLTDLRSEQWKVVSEYAGFDKGIDYDLIVFKKDWVKLKFEWDNWFEGRVFGPIALLEELRKKYGLK